MPAAKNKELHSPQTEAAMFYGLFLKGHSAASLRAEIDVSPRQFQKWMRDRDFDKAFRDQLREIYMYRKQVLAIFDSLVTSTQEQSRWQ